MSLKYLYADIKQASQSSSLIVCLKYSILSHTIHLTFLIRTGQSISHIPVIGKIFRVIIEYIIRVVFASDISCKAKIEKGLTIMHGHDIVIGSDVRIGQNCKIFNGVTLGNKDITQNALGNQPTIGDNVVLSTGAKILGPLTVGHNVIVGANSVVIGDCESNSIYVGVPAKKNKSLI